MTDNTIGVVVERLIPVQHGSKALFVQFVKNPVCHLSSRWRRLKCKKKKKEGATSKLALAFRDSWRHLPITNSHVVMETKNIASIESGKPTTAWIHLDSVDLRLWHIEPICMATGSFRHIESTALPSKRINKLCILTFSCVEWLDKRQHGKIYKSQLGFKPTQTNLHKTKKDLHPQQECNLF